MLVYHYMNVTQQQKYIQKQNNLYRFIIQLLSIFLLFYMISKIHISIHLVMIQVNKDTISNNTIQPLQ